MGAYLAQPITHKNIRSGNSNKSKIKYTLCEMQGWRRNMEDQAITQLDLGDGNSLFAVFDGHGGIQVSTLLRDIYLQTLVGLDEYVNKNYGQAMIKAAKIIDQFIYSSQGQKKLQLIRQMNPNQDTQQKSHSLSLNKKKSASRGDLSKFLKKIPTKNGTSLSSGSKSKTDKSVGETKKEKMLSDKIGCTANIVLITSKKIIVSNLGDSRSVICRNQKAIPLSYDHKPENARQLARISTAGGQVIGGRINDGLNLSRSFGDFHYKSNKKLNYDEQMVIAVPDIKEIDRTSDDKFMIVGCDGIFQKFPKEQTLITRISNERKMKKEPAEILKNLLDSILAKETNEIVGCDNMTIILIQFA